MRLLDAQLPAGWTWEPLINRYRVTKKPRDISFTDFKTIPFVAMESIPVNGREAVRFELRTPQNIASGTYFERGDVLLSKITPSFENGKQGLADNIPTRFGVASTEIIPLQALDGYANNRFLFFYLLHPEVRAALVSKMEGSTGRQRVPENAVRDFLIPLPPKSEQEKIAAVLWKIQGGIEIEEKIVAATRELKHSAMHQLFTRGLRGEPQKETDIGAIPESWDIVGLGRVAKVGNGSTPRRSNPAYWNEGKIPWLNSGKIHEAVIDSADQFVTELAAKECHLPLVKAGSVLVAITGQGKTLGNAAMVTFDSTINQHLAYAQFTTDQMIPEFVTYFLHGRYKHLRSFAHGYGSTKGALTCSFLKSYLIPKPEPSEQREIADILQAIDRKISIHERKRMTLLELFQTMLHQLMTGQIRVANLDIDTSEVTT